MAIVTPARFSAAAVPGWVSSVPKMTDCEPAKARPSAMAPAATRPAAASSRLRLDIAAVQRVSAALLN